MLIKSIKNQKNLLQYIALSYFDKAIIFLLPLLAFHFFKDQQVYVSIEYIYSVTTVIVPLIDLGLSGYFFYAYRDSENQEKVLKDFLNTFQRLYLLVSFIGLCLIAINYYIFGFEEFIVFIVSRLLFVLASVFLSSYYRLINRPKMAVYITLVSNFLSLIFLLGYFFADLEFSLWLIFIGQILFSVFYILKCITAIFFTENEKINSNQIKNIIRKTLLYSWPTILHAFTTMYIVNYGKINALSKMTVDDGVLLSLIQRLAMIIFLTHSSILAYLIKEIYVDNDLLSINKNILFKYIRFLTVALLIVSFLAVLYLTFGFDGENSIRAITVTCLIIAQTFFACIVAYLESHYGRENKNIITLYLALFGAVVFILILTFLKVDFLLRVSIAMFFSTLASFLASVFVLKSRNYKMV